MTIYAKNADSELLMGRLTGFRCPKCGNCCYVNLKGNIWCGQHKYLDDYNLEDLTFVPIPKEHLKYVVNKLDILEGLVDFIK